MSTDFSIKPVGAPVGRPASEAADDAIATELPAARIVAAADAGSGLRDDSDAAGGYLSHQAFLDRAAGAVVYQVVDTRTNLVLRQFPDDAMLRRRAYFRTLDMTAGAPTRAPVTDRTV
jgi:hypothetical protein